jgi:hypothetical protein
VELHALYTSTLERKGGKSPLGRPRCTWVGINVGVKEIGLDNISIPGRGTQPPVEWVPAVLSPVVKRGRSVTLTTHPHIVPWQRIGRSCTSSPPQRLHDE